MLIVSHRLSSLTECDQILVLDGGKVMDVGPHQVLVERCPVYLTWRPVLLQCCSSQTAQRLAGGPWLVLYVDERPQLTQQMAAAQRVLDPGQPVVRFVEVVHDDAADAAQHVTAAADPVMGQIRRAHHMQPAQILVHPEPGLVHVLDGHGKRLFQHHVLHERLERAAPARDRVRHSGRRDPHAEATANKAGNSRPRSCVFLGDIVPSG